MKKKASEKMTVEEKVELELIQEYDRWESLYENGGSDPHWPDGVNLNLVRCHIINYRRQLEEAGYFPEVYQRTVPPEIDPWYIAREDEIRENARKSLEVMLGNEDYQYILINGSKLREKDSKKICLWTVIGYVRGLQELIREDNLVGMRRYEKPDTYIQSFKVCREKTERILDRPEIEKEGQLNIFDFL